jgi:hypothetical protein
MNIMRTPIAMRRVDPRQRLRSLQNLNPEQKGNRRETLRAAEKEKTKKSSEELIESSLLFASPRPSAFLCG